MFLEPSLLQQWPHKPYKVRICKDNHHTDQPIFRDFQLGYLKLIVACSLLNQKMMITTPRSARGHGKAPFLFSLNFQFIDSNEKFRSSMD